VHSVFSKEVGL